MPLFQKPFSQKSTAFILVICLVGLSAGPILLLPRKVEAQCLVHDPAVWTAVEYQTALMEFYHSADNITQTGNLAQTAANTANSIWEKAQRLATWTLGVFLNLLLHQILAQLTNDIVNWIKNGGEPRFLSMSLDDWLDMAVDRATGAFIDQYLGAGWLCEPFDIQIKIALLEVPTFQEEVRCSLSDIVENIENFYDDFSAGGWRGWIELSQPQNNFYGALLMAQAEKTTAEAIAQEELENDMAMGQGYLSPKDCTWYDANGNLIEEQKDVWGTPTLPADCQPIQPADPHNPGATVGGFQGPCYKRCQILTPASTVNRISSEAITNFYERINAQIGAATVKAGPYQVYVQAIINALINRVITEGLAEITEEPTPNYGDPGASAGMPQVVSPEMVMQEKNSAESLLTQLVSLNNKVSELLQEQQANLAVAKLISTAYSNTIPVLDIVINGWCAGENPSYVAWAIGQKNNIINNLIPYYNNLINQLQNTDIPETAALISDIDTSINSVDDYIVAADNWLVIWEQVGGDADDPDLQAAQSDMEAAEETGIEDVQYVAETINGTVYGDDFSGLTGDIQNAVYNIVQAALALSQSRGSSSFPGSGTLYGELEKAAEIKKQAYDYDEECKP